jgi:DUF4097 and DUF4098 domain-containing protein YvlB
MKRISLLAAVISTTLYTTPIFAGDVYETISAEPGETLTLRTDSGSIEVDTHDENSVFVDVSISGKNEEDFEVSVERRGNEVLVTGERTHSQGWNWNGPRVKFRITVPEEFDLELKTAGGKIEIEDLIGDIDANTSGGSIKVGNIEGDVDLHTSGGSIRTDNINGEIDAHTSGGSIDVTFAKQPENDASLTTSGGSIEATFPEDVAIDIDASTSGGRVSSDFEINGRVKKKSIRGEINGGGPEIELRTSGGSISIEKD